MQRRILRSGANKKLTHRRKAYQRKIDPLEAFKFRAKKKKKLKKNICVNNFVNPLARRSRHAITPYYIKNNLRLQPIG